MCTEFLEVAVGKVGKSEKHIRMCESHKSERVLRAHHRMVECAGDTALIKTRLWLWEHDNRWFA